MASPPHPKRLLGAFDNEMPTFCNASYECQSNHALMQSDNLNILDSPVALQSFSSTSESVTVKNKAPNLSAFVNEVAAQQQMQIDQLDAQKQLLELKRKEVNSLKEIHIKLVNDAASYKRKIFLAQEASNVQKLKITNLRDEILQLLDKEKHLKKCISAANMQTFQLFKSLYSNKMQLYEEKVKASTKDSAMGKKIDKTKVDIAEIRENKEKIKLNLSNFNFSDESHMQQKLSKLSEEKAKLQGILMRKSKSLQEEENLVQSLTICIQNSHKRVAAQKLRLRNRIGEKRRLMQQFEEEAVALQIEIDDLNNQI